MSDQTSPAVHSTRQTSQRPCGHPQHVGTCAACQRHQLARWSMQLAQVQPAGHPAAR